MQQEDTKQATYNLCPECDLPLKISRENGEEIGFCEICGYTESVKIPYYEN